MTEDAATYEDFLAWVVTGRDTYTIDDICRKFNVGTITAAAWASRYARGQE